jgi:hypothetical protein
MTTIHDGVLDIAFFRGNLYGLVWTVFLKLAYYLSRLI